MSILEELHQQHVQRQHRLYADYIPAFLPKRVHQPVVKRSMIPPEWPSWGWHKIVSEVCEQHGIKVRDVMNGGREPRLVGCRWEIMWRMRNEVLVGGKQISLPEIGRRLHRHHASVLYGIRKYESLVGDERVSA